MENINPRLSAMMKISMMAAIYVVLSLLVMEFASGAVQLRVSEMLNVLPAYTPLALPGLTLGCAIFNLIGAMTGINPIGYVDAVVGSSATLIAAIFAFIIAKYVKSRPLRYILIPMPAVLVNAVIIGAELTIFFADAFYFNAFFVGLGQLIVCYGLGVPFMMALERNGFHKKIFS